MQAELLINELGEELGLSALNLDDNHACTIVSDDNALNLQFQPYDDTFLIYAVVKVDNNGFSSTIYERIASANLFGQETLGMHLGYYAPARAIVLSTSLPIEGLDAVEFANYLSIFLVELAKWQKSLTELMAASPDDVAQEISFTGTNMLRI